MLKRLLLLASVSSGVVLAAFVGCAGSSAGHRTIEPTVEPLTELEFDAFATEIAEQILAWLERGHVSLPVTITPPKIEDKSVERGGVAKSFSQRLAEGLSDRLLGAVRFGRTAATRPRLRCGISFSRQRGNEATRPQGNEAASDPGRTVTFRLWDADSNFEICRGSYDYQRRPKDLTALQQRLDERRLAARTPRSEGQPSVPEAAPPAAEPIAANVEPPSPEAVAMGRKLPASDPENLPRQADALEPLSASVEPAAGPGAGAALEPVVAHGGTAEQESPGKEAVASVGRRRARRPGATDVGRPKLPVVAPPPALALTPGVNASSGEAESPGSVEPRRLPRRRTVRIDRHEQGLAELIQEQAVYFSDHTITDELGRVIFLDRHAWDEVRMEVRQSQRTHGGQLSVELLIQAGDRPAEADIRVVYLDAQGRQVEVSPVRTYHFSPSYAKRIALHSSKRGAAEYIVLVAQG